MPTPSNQNIDDTDRKLLAQLQLDARLSLAELGRRVGLSAPSVADRLRRLEDSAVIRAYRAEIDPRALGYDLGAVIRIRPHARQIPKVAQIATDTPEVTECQRITGDDCFFMRLHVRDVEHLEEVLDRFTPYGQTTTSIVQSAPFAARGLALSGD
ncbi:MAG TPA: Lrp/AsnC family transcriptional regulator [Thermoleophilaceae bacterium]|jgi:Lrp/AsnC family leucine-responsive transcriptional regulator